MPLQYPLRFTSNVELDKADKDYLVMMNEDIRVDGQQLAELGLILFAAGKLDDDQSVGELLEGYGFTTEDFSKLVFRLKSITEKLTEYTGWES